MAIYALRAPSNDDFDDFESPGAAKKFLTESSKNGIVRFGWSYDPSLNLEILKNKSWEEMNEKEVESYKKSQFLLDIKEGDWVVQINLPEWGECIAGEVVGKYAFGEPCEGCGGDFRHEIPVDKNSIVVFNRNDFHILPVISRRLKLQGSHWKIYQENEFFQSIANLKNSFQSKLTDRETKELYYLKEGLSDTLSGIVKKIHDNHPGKALEHFCAEIFRKIPDVEVIENGSGGGSDYGADLIVKYRTKIPGLNTERDETMVVQIKSYEGEHWDTNAVKQLENAIFKFKADSGLIITTGNKTETLEKAFEELGEKLGRDGNSFPIELIAGGDVARFFLKYASDIL